MDGSSTINGNSRPLVGSYVDNNDVNGWNNHQQQQQQQQHHQEPSYQTQPIGIKTEQLSAVPTYEAYVAVTSAGPADMEVKPGLLDPTPPTDLTEMQRLSQEYQPDVTGPLVGELKSSKALAIEYADADPTYIRKTSSLALKYDSYRTVRGDGNCGWRALAFGFFELLLRNGDQNSLGMEHARIASLSGLMESVGFQSYIYEDFAEATFSLFTTLNSGNISPSDDAPLVSTFNDPSISDSIVTHFKFLTSAWMKSSPEHYQPFLSVPVREHCESQIEPYGVEIDHVGLMALIDCLILPAGMAVEIIYLDRSAGDEVNVHRFEKLEGEGILTAPDAPVLRLLYRPGHYDIVYKAEDLPVPVPSFPVAPSQPVQVSFLHTLPDQIFQATPAAGGFPSFFSPPFGLDLGGPPSFDHSIQPLPSPDPGNFRQSMLSIPEFQPSPFQPLPFQTTTFRNSPFNPSHFQSENFQPEIYQPPTSPTHSRKHDKHSSDSSI
ncbi:peptidase C65 Otubain-domain-containing protein [Tricharina praecox]|uniref:peptidase C65 Otubain-domain-containing protein n=1 Tax=Tricharina praecox TaxID=43433 RepID=UPI00221F46CB|nr:peptidase C65 Otubain-domain-containing protein [Tricharina praecox]KAI5842311.1 peptidase C65 Otubain-domain-containing protein [Tricharina praecox]